MEHTVYDRIGVKNSALLAYSKPSNIVAVSFLENSATVKTSIVETKGQWKRGVGFLGFEEIQKKIDSTQK